MTTISDKYDDYITACQILFTELSEPDLDTDIIDEALEDLSSALCLEVDALQDATGTKQRNGYPTLSPRPSMADYQALSIAFEARKTDLPDYLKADASESLRNLRRAVDEQMA